jgi:hypothetical protein
MIKNIIIAFLAFAVIGLSLMAVSGKGYNGVGSPQIRQRLNVLKKSINEACEAAKRETIPEGNVEPAIKTQKVEAVQDQPGKPVIVRESNMRVEPKHEKAVSKKPQRPEKSAVEVLKGIKKGSKKKNGALTTEELSTILSLLKSARETLRKTSFAIYPKKEEIPAKDDTTHISTTKKKSFAGPRG